ncbi:MAG: Fe-S-oxidoreductase [Candidatus Paceibacterota bacterium]|jgi:23S rRNA (adenine2503-C2)-methyltransferase
MNKTIKVPTGHIIVLDSIITKDKQMECLSLGDYGQQHNIKADFLGYTDDIKGVNVGNVMPLSEKWVITLSTQFGCSMNCDFCDVPKVGPGINISLVELNYQMHHALLTGNSRYTKRLNVHYARMGEPTFNWDVITHAQHLKDFVISYGIICDTIHPVLSTMCPKYNNHLQQYIFTWCYSVKNQLYGGEAGLQFSINSTDEIQRQTMFRGSALTLEEISELSKILPKPLGRKYTLNFAVHNNTIIDGSKLAQLFNPDYFMCKITPMHENVACKQGRYILDNGYTTYTPYKPFETELKNAGFDTLVFIPSYDEDIGKITCGNAILATGDPINKGSNQIDDN